MSEKEKTKEDLEWSEDEKLLIKTIREIDDEFFGNMHIHYRTKSKHSGIRSSQISSLIMYLIKKGIIKDECRKTEDSCEAVQEEFKQF